MRVYYNDHEPFVAQWLRNLIQAGLIPEGDVDERSITEVQPDDLRGYDQCHFFAGIGGWPYALQLAGWPDDRPVWTASLPCQPFSVAGRASGLGDERHLWPAFRRLVEVHRPSVCFGEQVASKDGRAWLAGVRAEMEAMGYAIGAADLCAAGIGAPQIRQRLYWVAHREGSGSGAAQPGDGKAEIERRWAHPASSHRRFTDGFGNVYRVPESAVPFVVNGFPGIVGRISAYGNAIVPQVGAAFIEAYLETQSGVTP